MLDIPIHMLHHAFVQGATGFAGQIQVIPGVFITPIPNESYCEYLWYFGFAMFACLVVGILVALILANVWLLYPVFWLLAAIIISGDVLDLYIN